MNLNKIGPVLPWRTRPAVWFIGPAILTAALFAARFVDRTQVDGYWPAVVGGSATFLLFSCTLAGSAAAIEASRMRRSRLDVSPSARSSTRLLLSLLGPCYLMGLVVQAAAVAGLSVGTWKAPGHPPVLLLAAFAAIIALHTAVGYALGRILPLPAAVPITVIGSLVWLGFAGSTDFFPLRWLAGYALNGCCDVSYQLTPAAPMAAILFSIPAAGAFLLWARPRSFPPSTAAFIRTSAAASLLIAASVTVALVVAPNTYQPQEARPVEQTRCTGSQPTICLFPEQLAGPGHPAQTLEAAAGNFERVGIRLPDRLTAAANPPAGSLSVVVQIGESPANLIHSLVDSNLPDPSTGSACAPARATASSTIYGIAEHWLAFIASQGIVDAQSVPTTSGDDGRLEAMSLEQLSNQQQLEWFEHNVRALGSCTRPFTEVPAK